MLIVLLKLSFGLKGVLTVWALEIVNSSMDCTMTQKNDGILEAPLADYAEVRTETVMHL